MKIENDKIKIPFYEVDNLAMISHVKSYCRVVYNTIPLERWRIELTD